MNSCVLSQIKNINTQVLKELRAVVKMRFSNIIKKISE